VLFPIAYSKEIAMLNELPEAYTGNHVDRNPP